MKLALLVVFVTDFVGFSDFILSPNMWVYNIKKIKWLLGGAWTKTRFMDVRIRVEKTRTLEMPRINVFDFCKVDVLIYLCKIGNNICSALPEIVDFKLSVRVDQQTPLNPKPEFSRFTNE